MNCLESFEIVGIITITTKHKYAIFKLEYDLRILQCFIVYTITYWKQET